MLQEPLKGIISPRQTARASLFFSSHLWFFWPGLLQPSVTLWRIDSISLGIVDDARDGKNDAGIRRGRPWEVERYLPRVSGRPGMNKLPHGQQETLVGAEERAQTLSGATKLPSTLPDQSSQATALEVEASADLARTLPLPEEPAKAAATGMEVAASADPARTLPLAEGPGEASLPATEVAFPGGQQDRPAL
jgi:hypothetical protein